jgi:hypothetical protein
MQSAAKMQKISATQRAEQLTADFELLTLRVQLDLAEDRFSAAIGCFREVVNITRTLSDLREIAVRLGIDLVHQTLPQSARLARCLLEEAAEIDSDSLISSDLWEAVHEREKEEAIGSVLTSADAALSAGAVSGHHQYLAALLSRYPGEARLKAQLKLLEAHAKAQAGGANQIKTEIAVKASEDRRLQAAVARARAREFSREGFTDDALDQLQKLQQLDPSFSGLQEELARITRRQSVPPIAPAAPKSDGESRLKKVWRSFSQPSPGERTIFSTAATLAFTLITLGIAGCLIWTNYSRWSPRSQTQATQSQTARTQPAMTAAPALEKVTAPTSKNPDDLAWSSVNPKDLELVEAYLNRFPEGANRGLAVQALSQIRVERRQVAEVDAVLRQYAAAWNARNVDSILALQHNLDRQTVEAQLSPLKSMVMNLSPAAAPRIEGNQATVRCLRTVSEVYEDGATKQSPEQAVTFVLAKRDGAWKIESARQSF